MEFKVELLYSNLFQKHTKLQRERCVCKESLCSPPGGGLPSSPSQARLVLASSQTPPPHQARMWEKRESRPEEGGESSERVREGGVVGRKDSGREGRGRGGKSKDSKITQFP